MIPRLWFRVFTLCIDFAAFASDINGNVVVIANGDTFTVLLNDNTIVRVRLHGIETQEKGQPLENAINDSLLYQWLRTKKEDKQPSQTQKIVFIPNIFLN